MPPTPKRRRVGVLHGQFVESSESSSLRTTSVFVDDGPLDNPVELSSDEVDEVVAMIRDAKCVTYHLAGDSVNQPKRYGIRLKENSTLTGLVQKNAGLHGVQMDNWLALAVAAIGEQTDGEKGDIGPKGEKGFRGEKGDPSTVQGPKGEKEDRSTVQGTKGEKGDPSTVQGTKGEKGVQGTKGEKGDPSTVQGTKGEKGDPSTVQGTKGEKGDPSTVQGTKGEKGDPSSVQGIKGEKGDPAMVQGTKGEKGDPSTVQGTKGEKGDPSTVQGTKGEKGDPSTVQGTKGEKGDPSTVQGTKGEKGDPSTVQGTKGADGAKGESGAKGATGSPGQQGLQGPKGDRGDRGANGAQGSKGDRGANGAQGPKGDRGDRGANGAQGPKGDRGDRGANGAQGPKGDKGDRGDPGPGPGQNPVFKTVKLDQPVGDGSDDGSGSIGYYVANDNINRISKYRGQVAFYGRHGIQGFIEDDRFWETAVNNNFTGQHRTYIHNIPYSDEPNFQGLIVSAAHKTYIRMSRGVVRGCEAIRINESLPVVSLSTKANDKACFGVISDAEEETDGGRKDGTGFVTVSPKELGDIRVYINSVGEGAVWVLKTNALWSLVIISLPVVLCQGTVNVKATMHYITTRWPRSPWIVTSIGIWFRYSVLSPGWLL